MVQVQPSGKEQLETKGSEGERKEKETRENS